MEFRFTKMHGAGNDFIMINDMDERCRVTGDVIAALCSRHRGIGSDGLILLRPSSAASFTMRYFNSDGGEADLCGNGARCAAYFARESGIAGRSMTFETRAGVMSAEILDDGVSIGIGEVRAVRLGMKIAAVQLPVHFGMCGVPHAVVVEEDIGRRSPGEFVRFARKVRNDPAFGPAGANVDIVSVTGPGSCSYRTYERGVEDETCACGTGAVVVATVLAHLGLLVPPVRCETRGGDTLEVGLAKTPEGAASCVLTGPVAVPFRGTFRIEDYERL
jgi:diaminopimelate epimerase